MPRRIVDAEGKNILILDPEAEPVNNEYAPMVIRQLNNDFRVKELIYLMAKRHAKHLKSAYISMEKLESLFREKKNRWWL
ncbi:MAG: hypothetical protein N3D11_17860 [Candidatus Sumerlaeia bacterium]|nr:hypothetical protein [Candidatus Sumerlaeia bacterium]